MLSVPRDVPQSLNAGLLWLHLLSGATISVACFLTLHALVKIMRGRRDVPFNGVFYSFSAFIVACGVSYGIDAATLLHPLFWMSGVSKLLTGAMAVMTLVALWRYTPEILALPSHIELQKAVWQLDSLLESTTTCVLAMNNDWKVDYLNRRARVVLNVKGEVRGQTLWEVFPPGTEESQRLLLQVMETRQPTSYEEYSEELGLWTTVQAHPWDNGGITLFFNDESEQKRLRSELQMHGLRDQRIEILARLSGELAHEIKNPLAIIHARASDMAERAEQMATIPAEDVAKTCGSIVRTSDRAMRILRGLAALAREGSHDPMQPADVGTIIDQTLEMVGMRCRTHGIEVQRVVPAKLPPLLCREVQIGQVLMNLLNNAFDAIDGSAKSERWVRVEAAVETDSQGTSRMVIDVVDGGPGISDEAKPMIMQSFYTTKPVGGGIGIGLSVSRSIALDHKGSLELRESGGHTCFRLSLPLHGAAQRSEVAA